MPFAYVAGPHDASLVIVGEAWGESEERHGIPFAGASGREFARMCIEVGWDVDGTLARALGESSDSAWLGYREEWLHRASIMLTNVFALRPINNNLGYLCAAKSELPSDYDLPKVRNENPSFVKPEFLSHLSRLHTEIDESPRKLVVTLGGTATWALVGSSAIGRLRGAVTQSAIDAPVGVGGVKCLPTYDPAAIFRAWQWRPILLADLLKARREREFSEVRRPKREVIVNPTIEQVEQWAEKTVRAPPYLLAPDIETMNGQIRCIGFARARDEAIVIPFIKNLAGESYWTSTDDELRAWYAVRALLESDIPKVYQNGLFDISYLSRMGIRPRNCLHDTMLLHHVLYPEMQKSLGFLGSVYCNESNWKLMRVHKGEEELKRDE